MKRQAVANRIRTILDLEIERLVANKEQYVQKPGVDFSRNRKLPLDRLIKFMINMSGSSLSKELYMLSEISNIEVTPSAFVQQRAKIKGIAFRDLFNGFSKATHKMKTFRGYRIFAADGTDINMPRNPNSETFIHPTNHPQGYNQIHLNTIYDILTHTYCDVELQPRSKEDERAALINMLKRNMFNDKAIIAVDRGYEGYNMFANFIETRGVEFICRVKDGGSGAIAEIAKLPMKELDKDVFIEISTSQTNDDKIHNRRYIPTGSKRGQQLSPKTKVRRWDFQSPYPLKFRVVRFLLDNGKYETIATSLPRDEFSVTEIKKLYHMRWGIETSYRELKYFTDLINLHGKSDVFITQEIYIALIIYNFCTCIAGEAIAKNSIDNTYIYQVNYSMAFFLCRRFLKYQKISGEKLLDDIGKYVEPVRPGRKDKRKMRPKAFIGFIYRVAA